MTVFDLYCAAGAICPLMTRLFKVPRPRKMSQASEAEPNGSHKGWMLMIMMRCYQRMQGWLDRTGLCLQFYCW